MNKSETPDFCVEYLAKDATIFLSSSSFILCLSNFSSSSSLESGNSPNKQGGLQRTNLLRYVLILSDFGQMSSKSSSKNKCYNNVIIQFSFFLSLMSYCMAVLPEFLLIKSKLKYCNCCNPVNIWLVVKHLFRSHLYRFF